MSSHAGAARVGARHPGPSWEIPAAGFAHVALFALVVIARCGGGDRAPLFKPEDVMVVEMAGPPASLSRMPQKAERAPDVAAAQVRTPDAPPPDPADMKFRTPDAPKTSGDPQADARAREDLLADIRRRQALRDLSAPVGKEDRAKTGDASGASGSVARAGVHDPALAKWVQQAEDALNANFHPLPAHCAAKPDLLATAAALVEPSGRIAGQASIVQSSENPSIDGACLRAFAATRQLPPTPANHPEGVNALLTCRCPR